MVNSRSVAKKALGHLRWSLTYRPNPGHLSLAPAQKAASGAVVTAPRTASSVKATLH
jgi:hypothetical protein